jgi:AcrR family transcriptional regulator
MTHRERQALATRAQVTDAARRLFASQGYVGTTIAAIAAEADIPVQTIYSAFGSKVKILGDLAGRVIGTIDPMGQHDEAMAHPDPAAGLRINARVQRQQYELMYDVISVYQQAALTDPEVAAAAGSILDNRERAFRRHLTAIAGHLRSTVDIALDLYLTLVLPEVYRTLVLERGWSLEEYETWLGDQFVNLLHPKPSRRRAG